jgi:hypothetical protein
MYPFISFSSALKFQLTDFKSSNAFISPPKN